MFTSIRVEDMTEEIVRPAEEAIEATNISRAEATDGN